ncbi:SIT4-associating protein Sap190p [Monosporozyma servazzii]
MSGSFWKFGQDYSTESSLAKLLNNAFTKIQTEDKVEDEIANKDQDFTRNETNILTEKEKKKTTEDVHQTEEELPDTEAGFKDYEPNLDVLSHLLDEEELYTELMCSNFKLLVYLKYPEVLSKLMDYVMVDNIIAKDERREDILNHKNELQNQEIKQEEEEEIHENEKPHTPETQEDEEDDEEEEYESHESEEDIESQRAHMAAEILSADVWPISATIIEHQDLLDKLWSITDLIGDLPIEASTYFMKINERLLDMNMSSMIDFILGQDDIVDRFLKHIDDPPLIDFFLKVISTDKPDINNGVIKNLKEQGLIPKLIELLTPQYDNNTQSAAADFLKALLAISGNCVDEISSSIGPNELTRELTSPEVMERLIQIMLNGGTSLSNGVGIIIELIRKNNSDYDYVQIMFTSLETHPPNDRDAIYLGHMLKLFHQYMPKFNEILVNTSMPFLNTSFGRIEPLGFERFKICELVAELLHCSNMGLLNEKKGEEIALERDTVRAKILADDVGEVEDGEGDKNSPTEHSEVTEKLNSLTIETEPPHEGDDSIVVTDSTADVVEDQDEAFAENILDDDSVAQQLTEKAVVGDLLKISLLDTQIITTIVEMFFHFSWNNFLHNVVFDIIQQIFNGPLKSGFNRFLLKDLLTNAEITKLIIEGDKDCISQEEHKNPRTGYMGHLTLIAEEIVKFSAYIDEMNISFSTESITNSLNDPAWKSYVETTLAERREKYDIVLGDIPPNDEEETDEYNEEETEADNYNSHVYGTEHIIFTNELDEDEDAEDNSEEPYEDATNHIPGELDENDEDEEDLIDEHMSSSPAAPINFHDSDFDEDSNQRGHSDDEDEDEEEYAEYSEKENKNYYEYIDHNGTKNVLFAATTEPDSKSDSDDNSDGDHQQSYSPNNFGQVKTKNLIPTSPAGLFDYDLTSSEDEDQLEQGQDYIEENDKRRKLSKRGSYSDEDNEDLLDDSTGGETVVWHQESSPSPSFVLSNKPDSKGSTLADLQDEGIFQHQFEIDEVDATAGPGLSRMGSSIHNLDKENIIGTSVIEVDDDDNYLDPNDDGQSYAKPNNPLYGDVIKGVTSYYSRNIYYPTEEDSNPGNGSEEELSENSDEDELENKSNNDDNEHPMEESFILYRSTSKGKEAWD